jgi:hypothetical protein
VLRHLLFLLLASASSVRRYPRQRIGPWLRGNSSHSTCGR